MTDIIGKNEALVEKQLENLELETPGVFSCIFSISNPHFLATIKMPKNVPDEILADIAGFLSFEDNTKNLYVNKQFHRVIEINGKKLPRQEVTMFIHDPPDMVDFSSRKKTDRLMDSEAFATRQKPDPYGIHVIEGSADVEFPGLNDIIVNEVEISDEMDEFEETFERIMDLVGGQLIPVKKVILCLIIGENDHMEELTRFRDIYSSTYLQQGRTEGGGNCLPPSRRRREKNQRSYSLCLKFFKK